MKKALHSPRLGTLCRILREARVRAGLRQTDLAERLGEAQSFVSKYEIGERRLDLIELEQVCAAMDTDLPQIIALYVEACDEG